MVRVTVVVRIVMVEVVVDAKAERTAQGMGARGQVVAAKDQVAVAMAAAAAVRATERWC